MEKPSGPVERVFGQLIYEFGVAGERTVSFLRTASDLLNTSPTAPRLGEAVAYCVREALVAVPSIHGTDEPGLSAVYAPVRRARRELEHTRGLSGESEEDAILAMLRALDAVDDYLAKERLHRRRLVDVVVARSGVRPMPGLQDVGEEYQRLLAEVQGKTGLHGAVDVETARSYLERCLRIFERIFASPVDRIAALDSLASVESPQSDDVERALEEMVTAHHLDYFMSRVSSVAWLHALGFEALQPPRSGEKWPVLSALQRLSMVHAAGVVDWLRGLRATGLDDFQDGYVAFAAHQLGDKGEELMLEILRSHPNSADIATRACLMSGEREPSRPFVLRVADVVLNASCPIDTWTKRHSAIEPLVAGTAEDNWRERASVVASKLARVSADEVERMGRIVFNDGSIADEDQYPDYAGPFELLRESFVGIAERAIAVGVEHSELLTVIDKMPGDLANRFRTWVLTHAGASSADRITELIRSIATRRPCSDDVMLVERLRAEVDDERLLRELLDSLPAPPSVDEAGLALAEGTSPPNDWVRFWSWRPVCPSGTFERWDLVLDMIGTRYGAATAPVGEAMVTAEFIGRSPMSEEDLEKEAPLAAAKRIASWRPEAAHFGESARYLGRTLEAVVASEPSLWAANPIAVVVALREPTYVQHYFAGLAAGAEALADFGEWIIQAVMLARRHPWDALRIGDDDFEFDPDWRHTDETGIALLGRLAHANVSFGDRAHEAWEVVLDAVGDKTDEPGIQGVADPLTAAINRPCTRALESLLELMGAARRAEGDISAAAFDALSASLLVPGPDGAQHRAILVRTLGFLQFVAGDWLDANRDSLFGARAPEGLGQQSVDLALKWGRPNKWLLENYRAECFDAVRRGVRNAVTHVCTGLLLDLDGYRPDEVLSSLLALGSKLVSEGGEALARLLRGDSVDKQRLERAIDFWDRSLALDLPKEAFFGFGWWTEVSGLSQERWVHLMAKTAARAAGDLDWAPKTAERAAQPPLSVDGMRILGLLASGVANPWERPLIGRIGVNVTRSPASDDPRLQDERARLRDQLLELGFFDAIRE
jgi:hypothetical protein